MAKASRGKRPHSTHSERPSGRAGGRVAAVQPVTKPDLALRLLSVFGVLLTAYLSWTALSGQAAALCTAEAGCDVVQGSAWSRLLGLPIALWGMLLYAALAWVAWRPAPRLTRWRRLWRLSFLGLAISVYLTLAGLVALQAVCAWCLLSLATMTAIFLIAHLSRPDSAPGATWPNWLLGNGLIALGLLATLQLSAMGLLERREDPRLRALAEHLETSGALFYGASWCPSCNEQKDLFGPAERRLPYVECSPGGRGGAMAFECVSARIGGYPTWIIDGQYHVEILPPERLARLSGFDWDGATVE